MPNWHYLPQKISHLKSDLPTGRTARNASKIASSTADDDDRMCATTEALCTQIDD